MNVTKPKWYVSLAVISIGTLLLSGTQAYADTPVKIQDQETVYSILNTDGSIKKTTVVDWLHLEGDGNYTISDGGGLNNVKNLNGDEQPKLQNNTIIWQAQVNGQKDIYYSGDVNKELPVKVRIDYYLDGQKIDAASLAGKSGTLKINITLQNQLKNDQTLSYEGYDKTKHTEAKTIYTPMLSLVALNVPTDHFSDIKSGDAMTVMTGKTMAITWMAVPNPETTISLEMKGSNIELDPLTITLIPKLPAVPDIPVKGELEQLTAGIGQFTLALDKLGNGITQLVGGEQQVKDGLSKLSVGLGQLSQANQAQIDLLKKSLDTNKSLLGLAQNLVAANPKDPNLQMLSQGLQGQQQMLTLLAEGGQVEGQPFPSLNTIGYGLKQSQSGVSQLADAMGHLKKGTTDLGTGIGQLAQGGGQMKQGLISGLNKLYAGEELLAQTKAAADRYDTFLGKPAGATGEVRFILKTDSIKASSVKTNSNEPLSSAPTKKQESFWSKAVSFIQALFL